MGSVCGDVCGDIHELPSPVEPGVDLTDTGQLRTPFIRVKGCSEPEKRIFPTESNGWVLIGVSTRKIWKR